ncbi:putative GTP-binding translation elongation/initiation factor [Bodo saltans virus]|uniref:GTP-binding translation elongation/initiation factor n=1 Tax=Bodo saltans virus TaxID=2024608 RepID=A0A2H4UUT7_9VIRU|nr:putative GTP-binding translation elongation/initiation factor [Bodo saltans virus]ATZ80634.1 putative GTP-binding translation elongation/initiation factor [Bodo saltans virus]
MSTNIQIDPASTDAIISTTHTVSDQITPTSTLTNVRETKCGIVIAGNVDAGKSTFIGCLISGKLDDGNGLTRQLVARHQHEINSGKTSDISTRIIDIPENNTALTLIDLCGHEKYFHTTTYGLLSHFPDYAFLIISANRDKEEKKNQEYIQSGKKHLQNMTEQHLRILMSLSIPVFIIVTRIDITPHDVYIQTLKNIKSMIEQFYGKDSKTTFLNTDAEFTMDKSLVDEKKEKIKLHITDYLNSKTCNGKQHDFPVLTISNKTGYFVDVVQHIAKNLRPRKLWAIQDTSYLENRIVKFFANAAKTKKWELSDYIPKDSIFYISDCSNPPGIGLVVSGIMRGESIKLNDFVYILIGKIFYAVRVKSIHNNIRESLIDISDHTRGSIAIAIPPSSREFVKRSNINKGAILTSSPINICFKFKAIITFFSKSATIKNGTSPVIHFNNVSQTARIIFDPAENDGQEKIGFKQGGQGHNFALITLKFKMKPEYVEPYNIFLIRSGDIHGIGMILSTLSIAYDNDPNPDPHKAKRSKKTLK